MQKLVLSSPIGKLGIQTKTDKIIRIEFLGPQTETIQSNQLFAKTIQQALNYYFTDSQHPFALPFELAGTPFQQKVWQQLLKIPVGEVASYGSLAKQLKTCAQAIGNACRENPIPLIVPCHRVVAQNNLGGFAGKRAGRMLAIKQWLLRHESALD